MAPKTRKNKKQSLQSSDAFLGLAENLQNQSGEKSFADEASDAFLGSAENVQNQSRVDIKKFRFDRFDPDVEDWQYYIMRFELELSRQMIEDIKVRAILLLSSIGPTPFKVIVDTFSPVDVKEVDYGELKQTLNSFYGKNTNVYAERRMFALRYRLEGESISQFILALRSLSSTCHFGRNLEDRLKEQLILGVNDASWQEELMRLHPTIESNFAEVQKSALLIEQSCTQQKRLSQLSQPKFDTCFSTNRVLPIKHNVKKSNGKDYNRICRFCGNGEHREHQKCPALGAQCYNCKGKDHFARVCRSAVREKNFNSKTRSIQGRNAELNQKGMSRSDNSSRSDSLESDKPSQKLRQVNSAGNKVVLDVTVNDVLLEMIYDPGAVHTVISKEVWKSIGKPKLEPAGQLVAYTDIPIKTMGKTTVTVRAFNKRLELPIWVIKSNDASLFGFDWTRAFDIPLPEGAKICRTSPMNKTSELLRPPKDLEKSVEAINKEVQQVLKRFNAVFSNELGTVRDHQVRIHLRQGTEPKSFPARRIPIALKPQVEAELDRLLAQGIIEPVDILNEPVEWVTPIVVVVKPCGKVRLCGDFRVTINQHVITSHHPMPIFDDILTRLGGGKKFSVIDLKDAYLQLEIEEESRKYLNIVTHKGIFRYRRMPFGVNFAPNFFQAMMDKLLTGIPGVACYLDDMIITGKTSEEHFANLSNVLARLQNAGIRAQPSKCRWMQDSVKFLGHNIDAEGIHPTNEHLKAISDMEAPTNLKEVRAFLGSVNYYSRFVKDLQTHCSPLHELSKKNCRWKWTSIEDEAFFKIKKLLVSSKTLVHYSENLPLVVSADASEVGLGAVLSHNFPDGSLKPIAFASRLLSKTEKNYSLIDREALALVYAVTKFYYFLHGRKFVLRTDHKPLVHIFGENQPLPKTVMSRLTRWAILLNNFDYQIEYISGKLNGPADALSRIPLLESSKKEDKVPDADQLLHLRLDDSPISEKSLKRETLKDMDMMAIMKYVKTGWPIRKNLRQELTSFYEKRDEISVENDILMWRGRVVVPRILRNSFLNMFHEGHPGITAMKSIAKMHAWWPKINDEIEKFVLKCKPCQSSRPTDPESPVHYWNIPTEPWSRIHIDFAGPFESKMWLIVVDATTKWLEVVQMNKTTANATILALREIFCRLGVPRMIVSDNGPQFTAHEFESFCQKNNIRLIHSTPYHPRTNGLAERAVKTFKNRIRAAKNDNIPISLKVQRFLISYRNSEHALSGKSPAQMMFGRALRTPADLIKPDVHVRMELSRSKKEMKKDHFRKVREFGEEEEVWVKNNAGRGFVEGRVVKRRGPLSYLVDVNGDLKRYHTDQMKKRLT